jgi:hypothetical protein
LHPESHPRTMQDNGYRAQMLPKTDEALTDIITNKRKDFNPGAIADAENILRERGFEIEYKDVYPIGAAAFPNSKNDINMKIVFGVIWGGLMIGALATKMWYLAIAALIVRGIFYVVRKK